MKENQLVSGRVLSVMQDFFKHNNVGELEYGHFESWDSLAHMEFISEIEKSFDIQLTEDEMIEMTNFQSVVRIVLRKNLHD